MEFKELVQMAEEKVGGRTQLAAVLGQNPNVITNAKAGQRGLPLTACVQIANILEVDAMAVAAASELATKHDANTIKVLSPFVQRVTGLNHAAGIILTMLIAFLTVSYPAESDALSRQQLNDNKHYRQLIEKALKAISRLMAQLLCQRGFAAANRISRLSPLSI